MPTDPNDPLAKQNMMDRYHGKADPVAEKYMRKIAGEPVVFSCMQGSFARPCACLPRR